MTGVEAAVQGRVVTTGLNGVIAEWSDFALNSATASNVFGRDSFRSPFQISFLICASLASWFRAQLFGQEISLFLAMSSGEGRPFGDALVMGFGGVTIGPDHTLPSRCSYGWYPNRLLRSTSHVYSRMLRFIAS